MSAPRILPALRRSLRSSTIRTPPPYLCAHCLHTTPTHHQARPPTRTTTPRRTVPRTTDRGPASKEETQTDFGAMDMLGNTAPPATNIDACLDDGFVFGSGVQLRGSGTMLAGGEVFRWSPWLASSSSSSSSSDQSSSSSTTHITSGNQIPSGTLLNAKGQFSPSADAWNLLDVLWPKPDILIVGTGATLRMLDPRARRVINDMGIRLEVLDTRNASAQYNLLATERGIQTIAAALVPIGWEGR